jgi:2,3-bisphosphoglycerate-independent phosphoglycerate mutase
MDEYLEPIIFLDDTGKDYSIQKNDGIFFFNFRADRPRQLSYKITERAKKQNLFFATMTEYHPDIEAAVAFPPIKIGITLAAKISKAGFKQAHIAETEKYGHVTFFFNGGRQTPHKGEKHYLIESRKDVPTHDLAPEMRAREIADKAIERLEAGDDFLVMNFANADMVGHTANVPAIIIAVETVDRELKRVVDKILSVDGIALITADHGNAELNIDPNTLEKHTAHTTNMVPCILVSNGPNFQLSTFSAKGGSASGGNFSLPSPTLADIAPTVLSLMHLKKPASMTGKSLISFPLP